MQPPTTPEMFTTGSALLDTLLTIAATTGVIRLFEQGLLTWQRRRDRIADSATNEIVKLREDLWNRLELAQKEQQNARAADVVTIASLREEIGKMQNARVEDARLIGELRGQVIVLQAEIANLQGRLAEAKKEIDEARNERKGKTDDKL